MVDFEAMKRKIVSDIHNNQQLKEVSVPQVMFMLNTTNYYVAKAIVDQLCSIGFLRKEGKRYLVVEREYSEKEVGAEEAK